MLTPDTGAWSLSGVMRPSYWLANTVRVSYMFSSHYHDNLVSDPNIPPTGSWFCRAFRR